MQTSYISKRSSPTRLHVNNSQRWQLSTSYSRHCHQTATFTN